MNPEVALMILNLSCVDPEVSFRDFYRTYYHMPAANEHWLGSKAEPQSTVVLRFSEAIADYTEYRAARANQCKTSRLNLAP